MQNCGNMKHKFNNKNAFNYSIASFSFVINNDQLFKKIIIDFKKKYKLKMNRMQSCIINASPP